MVPKLCTSLVPSPHEEDQSVFHHQHARRKRERISPPPCMKKAKTYLLPPYPKKKAREYFTIALPEEGYSIIHYHMPKEG